MFCKICYYNLYSKIHEKSNLYTDMTTIINEDNWPTEVVRNLESIKLNFSNFSFCEHCDNECSKEIIQLDIEQDISLHIYFYSLNLLKKLYIESIIISLFFNFITQEKVLEYTKKLVNSNHYFCSYIKYTLTRTNNYDYKIFSSSWKGSKIYYYEIFESLLEETLPSFYFELSLINDMPIV